ncbi:MAG TPA: response regulator [Herpetosiphonaceae bacterium]
MSPLPAEATVLVVEDQPDNLLVAEILLREDVGVRECLGARSADAAFALAATAPPIDLVLLDLQMPGEDGFTALGRLRRDPRFGQARIIALTALVMASDVERARRAGFEGFIGKPIDIDRFPGQIRRALAGEPVWEPQ